MKGSLQERFLSLMTFGIPVNVLPLQKDGNTELEYHKLWLEQRKRLEAKQRNNESPQELTYVIPGPKDILFGRDKLAQSHPGNVHYLNLISKYQDLYDNAGTKEKRFVISSCILCNIKESGARFLKFDGYGWVVADDTTARYKVTNAFRSYRKKQTANHASKKDSVLIDYPSLKRKDSC